MTEKDKSRQKPNPQDGKNGTPPGGPIPINPPPDQEERCEIRVAPGRTSSHS